MDNTFRLIFPKQCDLQMHLFNPSGLIKEFNKSLTISNGRVIIDCQSIQFIRPFCLNLLSAMISLHIAKGNTVGIKIPTNNDVLSYLNDMGFFEEFIIENERVSFSQRNTSVALKRLQAVDVTYLENISDWLHRNADIPSQIAQDIVSISLLEVINNVFDHSQSKIGCYISAQAYHRENRIILSILDMGIGFLNSLKEAYPTLKDDIEAIKFAVKEGVSSKRLIEKRVRGVGLSNISGFLRNRGEIEIISYTGYWRQRHDGSIHTKRLLCPLPGSCVNLIIDKQNVLDISSITDSIWGD